MSAFSRGLLRKQNMKTGQTLPDDLCVFYQILTGLLTRETRKNRGLAGIASASVSLEGCRRDSVSGGIK
jgi:hypothetical protein